MTTETDRYARPGTTLPADIQARLDAGELTLMLDKTSIQERGNYKIKRIPIAMGAAYWNYQVCQVLDADDKVLGQYVRNYHNLYHTFFPFEQGGKEYALYSPDYTATRVMRLPECVDLCGESRNAMGFCPTGFYVPGGDDAETVGGKFGFVVGCVWGDDSGGWKLEYLDLSRIEEGVLTREAKFGYVEMIGSSADLDKTISAYHYDEDEPYIEVGVLTRYDLRKTGLENTIATANSAISSLQGAERLKLFDTYCSTCGEHKSDRWTKKACHTPEEPGGNA